MSHFANELTAFRSRYYERVKKEEGNNPRTFVPSTSHLFPSSPFHLPSSSFSSSLISLSLKCTSKTYIENEISSGIRRAILSNPSKTIDFHFSSNNFTESISFIRIKMDRCMNLCLNCHWKIVPFTLSNGLFIKENELLLKTEIYVTIYWSSPIFFVLDYNFNLLINS